MIWTTKSPGREGRGSKGEQHAQLACGMETRTPKIPIPAAACYLFGILQAWGVGYDEAHISHLYRVAEKESPVAATGLLGANQTEMMTDILAEFLATRGAWTMKFEDGWFAYFEDELPLGPFETETEAAEAANRAGWLNRFNPHLSESLPLLVGPVALPKMAQLFGSEGRSALLDLDELGRLLLGSLDHGPLLRDHALALTH